MTLFPRRLAPLLCILLLSVATAASAASLVPGQVLTVALSEDQPGGEAARATYFQNVFPMSQAAGMRELSTFKVEQVLAGDGAPQGAGLYAWPDPAAVRAARDNPRYVADYRPLRPEAWKQLQALDLAVETPLELEIDRGRPHTLALLWLKDRAEYERYYAGTAGLRERLGTRTVLVLPAHRYEKLTEGEIDPPDLVVLLRWESAGAIDGYTRSEEFQAHRAHFERGVERLEWYRMGFWD